MSPWIHEDEPFTLIPEGYIGFVYRITNIKTNKQYLGRKLFRFTRTRKVKGKTRRVKKIIDSDWQEYFGSNALLQEEVKVLEPSLFKREILHLCKTKGEMNYLEAKEIFKVDAIISPEYYNESIQVRVHRSHLKNLLTENIL